MTDSALQEIELPFGGRTFRLRPNWRKLIEVEASLQQATRPLGLKFLRYEASFTEILAVLWVLLKDEKDAPPRDTLGETLLDEGYDPLMVPIGNFLLRAIRGNKIHEQDELEKREQAKKEGGDAAENPPKPPSE